MSSLVEGDSAIALTITVGVLAAFGVSMFLVGRLRRVLPQIVETLTTRVAWVYVAFLFGGVALAFALGVLQPYVMGSVTSPGRLVAALALVPVAVVVPYFAELVAGSMGPGTASGAPIFGDQAHGTVAVIGEDWGEWWTLATATAVMEEILFRGMLLHALAADGLAFPLAILLSGLVFGAHHVAFGIPAIVGKLVAGLAWGGLVVLAGTLWVPILAHLGFQALVWRRMRRLRGRVA